MEQLWNETMAELEFAHVQEIIESMQGKGGSQIPETN